MNDLLEAVLDAYDKAVDAPRSEPPTSVMVELPPAPTLEPYSIDDALSTCSLQAVLDRTALLIWEERRT